MNSDQLKGQWTQFKGKVKEAWGDLTDDDLDRADGERDQIVGMIQEKYGKTREVAEREFDDWLNKH